MQTGLRTVSKRCRAVSILVLGLFLLRGTSASAQGRLSKDLTTLNNFDNRPAYMNVIFCAKD